MFIRTTRRADRDAKASGRLERLIKQLGADPPRESRDLPADQQWVDLSEPPAPDPPAEAARPPDSDTGAGSWWRDRAGRLVQRWVPGADQPTARRRLPAVLIGGGVVVAVAVGVVLSSGRGPREAAPDLPAASVTAAPTVPGPPGGGGSIVVSVIGTVARPGLVTLPDGARVDDALRAAGGPVPGADLGGLNLARRLTDGEQVYVGVPAPPAESAGPGPDGGQPGRIDLNSASVAQLDTLPGVGEVTAQRIVEWRTRHGRFTRVEQLREIDGIGPTRFAKLKDLVVVR